MRFLLKLSRCSQTFTLLFELRPQCLFPTWISLTQPTNTLGLEPIPCYLIRELDGAITAFVGHGFTPRFYVKPAVVRRPRVKRGHLTFTFISVPLAIADLIT